ncbi:MAG TPA: hypothetical protein VK446_14760 [Methylocystis sp.]|nr:hypothetical protein [Methylocystis sp.]
MTRKLYILVFSAERVWVLADAKPLAKVLDVDDKMYILDGNIVFLYTAQDVEALTQRLRAGPVGEGQFFIADISESSRAGNMAPKFWDLLRSKETLTPAA